MKISTIIVSSLLAVSLGNAQTCSYTQKGSVDIGFTAFKTPLKVGVGGHFNEVGFSTNVQGANSLDALLVGATLHVNKKSVNTNNSGRDVTLTTSFFDVLNGDDISAKVLEIKEEVTKAGDVQRGIMTTRITLNDVTVKVPLRYHIEKGVMKGEGTIDLLDFKANNALESINKACFDLHKGKTWADVVVSFSMNIDTKCK
ncbi:MAG TPA: YceI family protein [Helicobacteraceae bacterium]|nr:YceI family protein [Helicobacteraceae bacterium]